MRDFVRRFLGDQSGATAIEYALIAALLAAAIVGVVGALGQQLSATYTQVAGLFN